MFGGLEKSLSDVRLYISRKSNTAYRMLLYWLSTRLPAGLTQFYAFRASWPHPRQPA